jgi:hypothetical protein
MVFTVAFFCLALVFFLFMAATVVKSDWPRIAHVWGW